MGNCLHFRFPSPAHKRVHGWPDLSEGGPIYVMGNIRRLAFDFTPVHVKGLANQLVACRLWVGTSLGQRQKNCFRGPGRGAFRFLGVAINNTVSTDTYFGDFLDAIGLAMSEIASSFMRRESIGDVRGGCQHLTEQLQAATQNRLTQSWASRNRCYARTLSNHGRKKDIPLDERTIWWWSRSQPEPKVPPLRQKGTVVRAL